MGTTTGMHISFRSLKVSLPEPADVFRQFG
jgi:hypothetical protein